MSLLGVVGAAANAAEIRAGAARRVAGSGEYDARTLRSWSAFRNSSICCVVSTIHALPAVTIGPRQ